MPLGLACPAGFTESSTPAGRQICLDAAGYTANSRQCSYDVARHRCAGDIPFWAVLGAAVLFLPGWWKLVPAAAGVVHFGISEFGGPSCPSLVSGKVRPVPGFPCGGE